jgi:hypothetical protein
VAAAAEGGGGGLTKIESRIELLPPALKLLVS